MLLTSHGGERAQRDRLAGARFHVNLVEHVGRFTELRFDFENHAKLIELGENDRDLPLAERIVKRVVDRLGEHIEARRFFAINIDIQLQAIDLLIAGDVAELRQVGQVFAQVSASIRPAPAASASCKMYWNCVRLTRASICRSCAACMNSEMPSTLRVALRRRSMICSAFARWLCGLRTI